MAEKYVSQIEKLFFTKNVENNIKYDKTNTNNAFGEITATSVPGGNQVDGLPPASSRSSEDF